MIRPELGLEQGAGGRGHQNAQGVGQGKLPLYFRNPTDFFSSNTLKFLLALLAYSSEKTRLIEEAQVQKLQEEVELLKEQIKLKDAALTDAQHLAKERLKDNIALHKVLDGKFTSDRPLFFPTSDFCRPIDLLDRFQLCSTDSEKDELEGNLCSQKAELDAAILSLQKELTGNFSNLITLQ